MNAFLESMENLENFLAPFLRHLDPSPSNIILVILAIFIPFFLNFSADIFKIKKRGSEESFQKMVLAEEIIRVEAIFLVAVSGALFFAFFGNDPQMMPVWKKIFIIFVTAGLVIFFWRQFKKILQFSKGDQSKFEKSFLEKLRFSNCQQQKNQATAEKMMDAWRAFWNEKTQLELPKEKEFTEIFIRHIDDAIKHKVPHHQMIKSYTNNIEKKTIMVG